MNRKPARKNALLLESQFALEESRRLVNSRARVLTSWCAITGAPGAGKSTLIGRLAQGGRPVILDPARSLISALVAQGMSIASLRAKNADFRATLFLRMLESAIRTPPSSPTFFDYALPDNIAFYEFDGLSVPDVVRAAASMFRINHVFVLASLPLSPDPVRVEDRKGQESLDNLIRSAYRALQYPLVEIAPLRVEERLQIVLQTLGGAESTQIGSAK